MIMKSASVLAKLYELEQYLDKPAELNEAILNMMLLQETIQIEKTRRKMRDVAAMARISIKKRTAGKFVAGCSGDQKYGYAVETALKASTSIVAVFQRNRFVSLLRSMGVPEDRIAEYSDSVVIDDDTHCVDQE